MIRTILAALVMTMLIAATPGVAQTSVDEHGDTMSCRDEMARSEPAMNAMNDPIKKAAAMKEIGMAEESLGKNDETICMAHVYNAMNIIK